MHYTAVIQAGAVESVRDYNYNYKFKITNSKPVIESDQLFGNF